jgi:hypothetical protein
MMADPPLPRQAFQESRLHAQLRRRLFQEEEIVERLVCNVAGSRHCDKLVSAEGRNPPPTPGKSRPTTENLAQILPAAGKRLKPEPIP